MRSPTVTTMRFQPTMVPRPSAMATHTFTQSGIKRVPACRPSEYFFSLAVSAAENFAPSFGASRIASPVRYISLRRFEEAAAGTRAMDDVRGKQSERCEHGRTIDRFVPQGVADQLARCLDRSRRRSLCMRIKNALGSEGGLHEGRGLRIFHRAVERVGRRRRADKDEHDEAHAFLAIIVAMREGHARAGEDQKSADPPRWRRVGLGLLIELRQADK